MNLLNIVLICISSVTLGLLLGYKIAMWFWKPKNLLKNGKDLLGVNEKLSDTNKKQYEWFCYQLFEIGKWVKEKYRDDYIIEELKKLPDHQNIVLEDISDEEKINRILDKINTSGMKSLSDIEKKFLNDLPKKS